MPGVGREVDAGPQGPEDRVEKDETQQAAARLVAKAKARFGPGWALLGPDIHEAFVAREALMSFLGQHGLGPAAEEFAAVARMALKEGA